MSKTDNDIMIQPKINRRFGSADCAASRLPYVPADREAISIQRRLSVIHSRFRCIWLSAAVAIALADTRSPAIDSGLLTSHITPLNLRYD